MSDFRGDSLPPFSTTACGYKRGLHVLPHCKNPTKAEAESECGQASRPLLIGMVFITGNYCTSRTPTNTEDSTGRLACVGLAQTEVPAACAVFLAATVQKRRQILARERKANKKLDLLATAASKKVLNFPLENEGETV